MNMQSTHNETQLILTYSTVALTRRVESRLFHLTLPCVNVPLTAFKRPVTCAAHIIAGHPPPPACERTSNSFLTESRTGPCLSVVPYLSVVPAPNGWALPQPATMSNK